MNIFSMTSAFSTSLMRKLFFNCKQSLAYRRSFWGFDMSLYRNKFKRRLGASSVLNFYCYNQANWRISSNYRLTQMSLFQKRLKIFLLPIGFMGLLLAPLQSSFAHMSLLDLTVAETGSIAAGQNIYLENQFFAFKETVFGEVACHESACDTCGACGISCASVCANTVSSTNFQAKQHLFKRRFRAALRLLILPKELRPPII